MKEMLFLRTVVSISILSACGDGRSYYCSSIPQKNIKNKQTCRFPRFNSVFIIQSLNLHVHFLVIRFNVLLLYLSSSISRNPCVLIFILKFSRLGNLTAGRVPFPVILILSQAYLGITFDLFLA